MIRLRIAQRLGLLGPLLRMHRRVERFAVAAASAPREPFALRPAPRSN